MKKSTDLPTIAEGVALRWAAMRGFQVGSGNRVRHGWVRSVRAYRRLLRKTFPHMTDTQVLDAITSTIDLARLKRDSQD